MLFLTAVLYFIAKTQLHIINESPAILSAIKTLHLGANVHAAFYYQL